MKLRDVPQRQGIKIKLLDPDFYIPEDAVFTFSHIEGMYSLCHDEGGNRAYLAASAEVEIVEDSLLCV